MKGEKRGMWRHRVWVILTLLVAVALMVSLAGCERPSRSKSEGLPTPQATAAMVTGTVAVSASPTIISAEPTATPGIAAPSPTLSGQDVSPTATSSPTQAAQPGNVTYTVQSGDTLYSIAQRYGMTVDELMALNKITDPASLTVGQVLIISTTGGTLPSPSPTTTSGESGQETVHIVQRGENLFRIALRYGTTVQAVASRNNIVNPSLIYVGQQLIIPVGGGDGSTPSGTVHIVQPGENLYRIALRYSTTPWAIAVANGLSNTHYIYVGQRLRIP